MSISDVKARIRFAVRMAKAAATDKRLPKPVRLLFAISLAIKAVPFPDFGVDEIGLGVGILLLATVYRGTWRTIMAELRETV